MNFLEKLSAYAQNNPTKAAVVDQDATRVTSYEELDRMIGCVASKLKSQDLPAGSFVVLNMGRCVEFIAAYYGVIRAGFAVIPTVSDYPQERIQYIIENSESPLLITESFFDDIDLYDIYDGNQPGENDIVAMNYTSGSTGQPKGVCYSMKCVNEGIRHASMLYDGLDEIVTASSASMAFAAFSNECMGTLYKGGTVHILSEEVRRDVGLLSEYYNKHKIICGQINPSMLRFFKSGKDLKRVFATGQRVSGIWSSDYEIWCVYGLTEAFTAVCAFPIDQEYENTPIGKPLEGNRIEICDADGNEVPDGTEGEICVIGYTAEGYYKMPEKTAEAFEKLEGGLTKFHTNDLGYRDEKGNIVYLERMDWMIKINGQRIEPFEVETAVASTPGVSACIIKDFQDTTGRTYLCAYYIAEDDVLEQTIVDYISRKIPAYMIPAHFIKMDKFPLTVSGKYDRSKLEAPEIRRFQHEYEAPANEKESKVCSAMEEVLGADRIGRNDDFFEMGGDSISVLALITKIDNDSLNVADVYKYRTPVGIAGCMKDDVNNKLEREYALRQNEYELMPYQQHYYDYWRLYPNVILGNTPLILGFSADAFDAQAIADAVKTVIKNHPSYNTVFIEHDDGSVTQRYVPESEIVIETIHLSEDVFQAEKSDLIQTFNLLNGFPYRFKIICTEEKTYLFMDAHHIVSDKASSDIVIKDILSVLDGNELKPDLYYTHLDEVCRLKEKMKDSIPSLNNYMRHPKYDGIIADKLEHKVVYVDSGISVDEFAKIVTSCDATQLEYIIAATLQAMADYNDDPRESINWLYSGRTESKTVNMTGLLITAQPVAVDMEKIDKSNLIAEIRSINERNMLMQSLSMGTLGAKPVYDDALTVNYIPKYSAVDDESNEGISSESMINDSKITAKSNTFYIIVDENYPSENLTVMFKYNKSLYCGDSIQKFIDSFMRIFTNKDNI